MNDHPRATVSHDVLTDAFAAELTRAAYQVALRHGKAGTWLDLELDIWRALADTIKQSERNSFRAPMPISRLGLPLEPITRLPSEWIT